MVLASSSLAEAVPGQPWLVRLRRILLIAETGVVVLVESPPERLGDLVRCVMGSWPAAEVLVRADGLASLPAGSTVVLCLREQDFEWLNRTRPVVRGHRLVLFGDPATVTALSQRAFDFYDWISHRIEAPPAPPPFAVRALRRAACLRAARVVWGGGDLGATFAAALPGRTLEYVSVAQPYASLVEALRPRKGTWIALQHVDIDVWSRRARWALAEAGRYGRTLLVQPRSVDPGEPIIHAMPMPIEAAAETLFHAGAARPARLAALLDGEPEAIEQAAEMARGGASDDAIESALLAGDERPAPVDVRASRRLPDWPERVESAIQAEDLEVADRWASAWRASSGGPAAAAALATVRALQGRGEEAISLADEAMTAAREDPAVVAAAHRALTLAHIQRQDVPAMAALLEHLESTGVPAQLAKQLRELRILALVRLGRIDEAGMELLSALGTDDPEPAVLARSPTLAVAWAELEMARGHAAKAADRMLRAAPLIQNTVSGAHLFQGALVHLLIASRRPADAERCARELLATSQRTGRDATHVRLMLGQALLALGRFGEAQTVLKSFLGERSGDPRIPDARSLLAMVLMQQGRWSESDRVAGQALADLVAAGRSSDPLQRPLLSLRAEAARREGRPQDALELLRSLLRQQEASPGQESAAASTLRRMAEALLDLDRPRDAEPLLRRALRIGEATADVAGQARTLAQLARAQSRRGVPQAADAARRALQLANSSAEALPGVVRAELEAILAGRPRLARG